VIAPASEFQRLPDGRMGPGKTVEYKAADNSTLAYLDYTEDRELASVTVFTPGSSFNREYGFRPAAKAEAILLRHLKKEGYEPGEVRS
jgi:hypothetical protein